jgi:radical SAM superfamily enzyme YgiQ (UPF0313 family)
MSDIPEHNIKIFSGYSLFIEMPDNRSLRLDREGRWSSYQKGLALYRRTLDSKIIKVQERTYSLINLEESEKITGEISSILEVISKKSGRSHSDLYQSKNNVPDIKRWIQKSIAFLHKPIDLEVQRFNNAYPEGIQILPPDRYRDLVIQPALGCPSGQCTFCAFYKNNRFRVLTDIEFDRHLEAVRNLFGENKGERNGIFLDSASALSLSQRRMIRIFDKIADLIPNSKRGIAAFLDPDNAPKRNLKDFIALKDRGLSQVTIGLETGYPFLRKRLGKSEDLSILKRTVKIIRDAGIQVALTILVGAGGSDFIKDHHSKSTQFIQDLGLSKRDIIYLSPLSDSLSPSHLTTEISNFGQTLKKVTNARISPYHMERFYYFS